MKIIRSGIFEKFPEIVFGFSTKIGLNRKAPFHFNISKSVSDDDKTVEENRAALVKELGLSKTKICFQKQIHSDIVTQVDETYSLTESDALYTAKKNISLVISSADCVPVFLYDPAEHIIAGIHSGWMGTRKKITEKTLDILISSGVNPSNIIAFIGPCISQKNYEVGSDVAGQFDSKYVKENKNKLLLDLKQANYDMLRSKGVEEKNIEVSQLCSFEEKEKLHSYRREGKISGRAVGIISIRGEKIVT